MIKVLIVEDHPMIADAYETYVKTTLENTLIRIADSIEKAECFINSEPFDLAICDIQLGKVGNPNILSGIGIAELLKKKFPNIKLIIATSINDLYRVTKIKKQIEPNAFLIKNDFHKKEFKDAILSVINNEQYYSKTVKQLLTKRDQFTNEYPLELKHFHLLLCLKQGYTNIQLEQAFNISNKTVLNWKNKIADVFEVDIKEITQTAIQKGYM